MCRRPGPPHGAGTHTGPLEAAPRTEQSRQGGRYQLGSWGSHRRRLHSCHTSAPPHWAHTHTVPSAGHSWCSESPEQNTGRVCSLGNHSNQERTGHMTLRCNWAGSGSDLMLYSCCPMRCEDHSCTLDSWGRSGIQICTVHIEDPETQVYRDNDPTHRSLQAESRPNCRHKIGRAGSCCSLAHTGRTGNLGNRSGTRCDR